MNEAMKQAWLEISRMLGEPTREELDVFLRTWQRASQATREALAEQPAPSQYGSPELQALIVARAMEKNAAEQPAQQEPVARQYQNRDGVWKDFISEKHYKDTLEDGSWPIRNLYTSPPAQRKPLKDEEIAKEVEAELTHYWNGEYIDTTGARDQLTAFARAIEAKLKEKNT